MSNLSSASKWLWEAFELDIQQKKLLSMAFEDLKDSEDKEIMTLRATIRDMIRTGNLTNLLSVHTQLQIEIERISS